MSRVLPPCSTAGNINSVTAGLKKTLSESSNRGTAPQSAPVVGDSVMGDIMADYQAVSGSPTQAHQVSEGKMTLGELARAVGSEGSDIIEEEFVPKKFLQGHQDNAPRKTGASLAGAVLGAMLGK
jgi:hypothetical protein